MNGMKGFEKLFYKWVWVLPAILSVNQLITKEGLNLDYKKAFLLQGFFAVILFITGWKKNEYV